MSRVAIYDMPGKIVLSRKTDAVAYEVINVTGISAEMYFFEVTTDSKQKTIKKLILE